MCGRQGEEDRRRTAHVSAAFTYPACPFPFPSSSASSIRHGARKNQPPLVSWHLTPRLRATDRQPHPCLPPVQRQRSCGCAWWGLYAAHGSLLCSLRWQRSCPIWPQPAPHCRAQGVTPPLCASLHSTRFASPVTLRCCFFIASWHHRTFELSRFLCQTLIECLEPQGSLTCQRAFPSLGEACLDSAASPLSPMLFVSYLRLAEARIGNQNLRVELSRITVCIRPPPPPPPFTAPYSFSPHLDVPHSSRL